jgi:hypothetical protein
MKTYAGLSAHARFIPVGAGNRQVRRPCSKARKGEADRLTTERQLTSLCSKFVILTPINSLPITNCKYKNKEYVMPRKELQSSMKDAVSSCQIGTF